MSDEDRALRPAARAFDPLVFTEEIVRPLREELHGTSAPLEALESLREEIRRTLETVQKSGDFAEREKLRYDWVKALGKKKATVSEAAKKTAIWGRKGVKILGFLDEVERAAHAAAFAFL